MRASKVLREGAAAALPFDLMTFTHSAGARELLAEQVLDQIAFLIVTIPRRS
jgi:hypothetical protein